MSNPRATLRTRDSIAKTPPDFKVRRNHRWHGLAQGRDPKPGAPTLVLAELLFGVERGSSLEQGGFSFQIRS